MTFKLCGTVVRLNFTFAAVLCILLIAFPLPVVLCVLTGILLHEMGHLLCAALFHVAPAAIVFSVRGVGITMNLDCLSARRRFWIALAGPAVNLCLGGFTALLGLYTWAAVNGVIGICNLIPIPGLDGGDLLQISLEQHIGSNAAEKICLIVGGFVLFPTAAAYFLLLFDGMIARRSLLVFAYLVVLLCDGAPAFNKNSDDFGAFPEPIAETPDYQPFQKNDKIT